MTDEILDDLIQRVLDGEGTPEETRRLEARLASDPVVRERHAELKTLFDALAAVELEPAPTGMHESIMSAVRVAHLPSLPRYGPTPALPVARSSSCAYSCQSPRGSSPVRWAGPLWAVRSDQSHRLPA